MTTFTIFGDIKRTHRTSRLDGEDIVTLFGDVKIDCTRVPLEAGEHFLSITMLFGDVTLRLPKDSGIEISGFTLFGDVEVIDWHTGEEEQTGAQYVTEAFDTASTRIHLRVFSIFGDLELVRVPVSHERAHDSPPAPQEREATRDQAYRM